MNRKASLFLTGSILTTASFPSLALLIDNDIPSGTVGHLSVNVGTGGESREADITANRQASGDVYTEDLIYDYFSYVDTGSGGVRLSGTAPTSTGDDSVQSSGSFTGSSGNNILWEVDSYIENGGDTFYNVFTFTAETGELGDFRFYQYLDEDLESASDDVLVTRGTVATGDLELFTLDDTEEYGVSHGGALSDTQGLVNAVFSGWAADRYSELRTAITAGTATVSLAGVIDETDLPPITHPTFGPSWGPRDITSVLAWDVVATATSATIITTLGGVPDISELPPIDPPDGSVPVPATLALFGLGLAGLGWSRRKKA